MFWILLNLEKKIKNFPFYQQYDWDLGSAITAMHSLIAHNFRIFTLSRQNEPSATHFCQLLISHVFDDVSWEGDKNRLERKAPSILDAYPQN